MKKIILLGMPGSGKSTISKELSNVINIKNFELDEIFEERYSKITTFFKEFGEKEFRIKESEILKEALQNNEYIISAGGGVILNSINRELIFKDEITSIYLKTSPDTIYQRLKNNKTRPLLLVEDPKKEIENILLKRKQFYEQSDYAIETDKKTVKQIVNEIIEKL